MNMIYKIFLVCFILLAGTSACYNDLDMVYNHQTEPVVVIEAILTNAFEPFVVLLSKSTTMNDSVGFQEIDSANVFLSNTSGWQVQLKKTANGRYESDSLQAMVGEVYKLEVQVEGKWFYAVEELLPCNIFDSLYVIHLTNSLIYKDGLYVMIKFPIPPEKTTYYRAVVSKNDSVYRGYNDLLLFETSFLQDETEVMIPYRFDSSDKVVIQAYSISASIFDYFSAYAGITQGSLSPSILPTQNPPTNIVGGALGYFQTSSVIIDSIQIP